MKILDQLMAVEDFKVLRGLLRAVSGLVIGPTKLERRADYLPFFAACALTLFEAFVFFWSLVAVSCFLALSLAFGDLSPI